MLQLILDVDGENISLPESQKGGYTAALAPLSSSVEMISGRMVLETRGNVWQIAYQYGYFNDAEKNKIIAACQKGQKQAIRCGFLPPDSNGELTYSDFLVTAFTYPKFMWSSKKKNDEGVYMPVPLWGDFSVELREVQPND